MFPIHLQQRSNILILTWQFKHSLLAFKNEFEQTVPWSKIRRIVLENNFSLVCPWPSSTPVPTLRVTPPTWWPHFLGDNIGIAQQGRLHFQQTRQEYNSINYTPPLQRSWKGVYWFHLVPLSVRQSVCGQNRVRSVSSTILVGSISYLHILLSNFKRCGACKACFKFKKNEILANSLNL